VHGQAREEGERKRQQREPSGSAAELDLTGRSARGPSRRPIARGRRCRPARGSPTPRSCCPRPSPPLVATGPQSESQNGHARCVALGEEHGQAVEQEIDRPGRGRARPNTGLGRPRRGARREGRPSEGKDQALPGGPRRERRLRALHRLPARPPPGAGRRGSSSPRTRRPSSRSTSSTYNRGTPR